MTVPAVAVSANLSAGSGGVALQASAPLVTTALVTSPAKPLQVAVLSSASTPVAGVLASSVAPVQTTLAGVTSAVPLAAPTPGLSTPLASTLKLLTGGPAKKLKHG